MTVGTNNLPPAIMAGMAEAGSQANVLGIIDDAANPSRYLFGLRSSDGRFKLGHSELPLDLLGALATEALRPMAEMTIGYGGTWILQTNDGMTYCSARNDHIRSMIMSGKKIKVRTMSFSWEVIQLKVRNRERFSVHIVTNTSFSYTLTILSVITHRRNGTRTLDQSLNRCRSPLKLQPVLL